MAKYVPPSKRAGFVPIITPSTSGPPLHKEYGLGAGQLKSFFTHFSDSTVSFFSYPKSRREPKPRLQYDPSRTPESTPLPPSPEPEPRHPLDHIISHLQVHGSSAQPVWDSHQELWTYTNAQKFNTSPEKLTVNMGRPIPVFRYGKGESSKPEWWMIVDIRIVEARSDERKRMLLLKAEGRDYKGGRTAEQWSTALGQTWVKLKLAPAPASGPHYKELRPIQSLTGGVDGEVEKYMLQIGGLSEEIEILESIQDERREILEARLGNPKSCREGVL